LVAQSEKNPTVVAAGFAPFFMEHPEAHALERLRKLDDPLPPLIGRATRPTRRPAARTELLGGIPGWHGICTASVPP
jgi:hypothetical protein